MFRASAVCLALLCVLSLPARAQESAEIAPEEETTEDLGDEGSPEEPPAPGEEAVEPDPEAEKPEQPIEKPQLDPWKPRTSTVATVVRIPKREIKSVAPVVPIEEKPAALTEKDLRDRIEARARFLRSGDTASADAELAFIIEARQQLGVRNVVVASAALIHEANQAAGLGQPTRALELAEASARLSPDLDAAHWARAKLYFGSSWTAVDLIFGALYDVVHAKIGRFKNSVSLLTNVAAVIGLALFFSLAVFAAVQLFKYARYAAFDISRLLPSWFGTGEVIMLLLMAIAAPLVFRFGGALTVALGLGVVYAYQSQRERRVSVAAWVLLAISPLMIWFIAPLVTFHGSTVDAIETALSETFTPNEEAKLTEMSRSPEFGVVGSIALAHRHRVRGDLKAATDEYRRALTLDPNNVVARNNLGKLLFIQGNEEAARASFQNAANSGQRAEPLLNLASMLLDDSQFEQANVSIERARKLDRGLVEYYTQNASALQTRDKLLDAESSQWPLWELLFAQDAGERYLVTEQIFSVLGASTPIFMMPVFVALIAVLAFLLAKRSVHKPLSVPCPKCGVPADRDAPASYCEQCQSIFLKTIAVEPTLRLQKEGEVISYQKRRRWTERLLSLIAGAGDIFSGRPIFGMFLLFFFLTAIAVIRFTEGFVVNPWNVGFDPAAHTLKLAIAIVFAAVLALISVRQALK